MAFTDEEVAQLRASFFDLIPQTEDLSVKFYERMFREHPEVRAMFKPDMQSQQDKLMDTLATLLDSIEHPEKTAVILRDLGRRHGNYGATTDMYGWVERVLPEMIAEHLGDRGTPELHTLWARLMQSVGQAMRAGAQ